MEEALKRAGTYRKTFRGKDEASSDGPADGRNGNAETR
jgi:hypothetical protein